MFTGNVLCVYCRCQISFSGNKISYQNQRCANHNREHQFPGMHITIEEINNDISNLKNLPVSSKQNSASTPFKHPSTTNSAITTNPKSINSQTIERKNILTNDNKTAIRQNIPVPPLLNNNLGNFFAYNVFNNMYDSISIAIK